MRCGSLFLSNRKLLPEIFMRGVIFPAFPADINYGVVCPIGGEICRIGENVKQAFFCVY